MSKLPEAVGPYRAYTISHGLLFSSGQLPLDPETNELVEAEIAAQTKQSLENINTILTQEGISFSNIIKTTVLLSDINNFGAMNDVYAQYVQEPYPARSAFEVANLPKGALVEIEFIADMNK